MTRVFLAAGVAALAIAVPAVAGPHGGGGGHGNDKGNRGNAAANVSHGGGGGGGARAQARGGGGGGSRGDGAMRMQAFGGSHGGPHGGAAMRPQHQQRQQAQRHVSRGQERMAVRQQGHGHAQAQNRMAFQREGHGKHAQSVNRQQMNANQQAQRIHGNGMNQNRLADRQQRQANRVAGQARVIAQNERGRIGYGVGGCPPGLAGKGCMPPGIARQESFQALRSADAGVFRASRFGLLAPSVLGPVQAASYIGSPLSTVGNFVPLMALPSSVSYLYPDTPDYYYRYGDGYLYQVDRSSSLIGALIPLLAGGYLPGTYLPQSYMSSYVPDYYGLSSFYPANYNYGGYNGYGYGDYGYQNLCNRYANGVIYQVDCNTGMVENVIPAYAGGYGVGQMIPSAYSYYNVPMQYRDMYYPTADYSYWYAPGAIYQYDTDSSLITSVAALMSPGFSVGQSLPVGYDTYNVPYDYRATYYDTPTAWYRYNNGYIYQVDPTTQLVTAIVASLLT